MNLRRLLLCVFFASESSQALAMDELKISGFGSLTAGKVLDGSLNGPLDYNPSVACPCVITDWSTNGFYEDGGWSAAEDSKLGLQMSYQLTDKIGLTGQAISRGKEPTPELTWAFASYSINDQWQLDLGRKRLPLYYYSDFQDLGLAYPWISPPAELYGWETTNYNGASLRYQTSWGSTDVSLNTFAGNERVDDNPYFETYSETPIDSEWNDIVGTNIEFTKDWWTLRLVYMQTNVEFDYADHIDRQKMQAYGVAFNGDFESWFFRSEYGMNIRDYVGEGYTVKAPAYNIGVGLRFRTNWTAFLSTARYHESYENTDEYEYFRYGTTGITLRYDLTASSDIKFQYDDHQDDSLNFSGDATLVRISYDFVF